LYCVDVRLHLQYDHIAPGLPFHAALIKLEAARGTKVSMHFHDFWECFFVLDGFGRHLVNGQVFDLNPGDLWLIRPKDLHSFEPHHEAALVWINVAFPTAAWEAFVTSVEHQAKLMMWGDAPMPPRITLKNEAFEEVTRAFRLILREFVQQPTALQRCGFWITLLDWLLTHEYAQQQAQQQARSGEPRWLSVARETLHQPAYLQEGLPRLVRLSGVNPATLARAFRHFYNQTPTEFVNDLRLKRAAMLLASGSESVLEIAAECGFDNLSYFYRLFAARFGCTPRTFRHREGRWVAP
jgi:AraC-like DNA-binding protein/quercetin dioxygenase-like cupin family protein